MKTGKLPEKSLVYKSAMRKVTLLKQAKQDIKNILSWTANSYSVDFSKTLGASIANRITYLKNNKILHTLKYKDLRAIILRKYKYSIFYKIEEENIYI